MKRTVLLMLLFVSFICDFYGQNFLVNEYDKFTKKKTVQTYFEKIHSDPAKMELGQNLWMSFLYIDGTEYVVLKWCCDEPLTIDENASVLFLDSEGHTYELKNRDYIMARIGGGSNALYFNEREGVTLWLKGDFKFFRDNDIHAMRIYSLTDKYDFNIKRETALKLNMAYRAYEVAVRDKNTPYYPYRIAE